MTEQVERTGRTDRTEETVTERNDRTDRSERTLQMNRTEETGTTDRKDLLGNGRKWTGLDTFLFLLRTIWFFAGVAVLFQRPMERMEDFLLPAAFFLSYFIPQLFFRPQLIRPLAYVGTEILLTGGLLVYVTMQNNGDSGSKFLYLPLTIGYMTGRKGLWYAAPVVVVLLPLLGLCLGGGWQAPFTLGLGGTVNFLAYYLAFYGLGLALHLLVSEERKARELTNAIREKNETLELYALQVEEVAALTERNRLARELHDTVGHTFTSTIIGMDAVLYQIDTAPEEAKESLRELLAFTRQGLDETRRSIHQMAERRPVSLTAEIGRVAAEFERSTGTELELTVSGTEPACPPEVRLAALRSVQEGLTNAKRHGQASRIGLRLSFTPRELRLELADNGSGFDRLNPGFGLRAMRERIAALDGRMSLRSQPGVETVLECSIPLAPAEASAGTERTIDNRQGGGSREG